MLGINQSVMMGIISAQNNIQLAVQNQWLANSTYRCGRIRERQGLTDGNQDVIEKGQELQAKGKEMQGDTFKHLGDAMRDMNTATENAENYESYEGSEISTQNSQENLSIYQKEMVGEIDIVIGDAVRGSVNRNISAPRQSKINITV